MSKKVKQDTRPLPKPQKVRDATPQPKGTAVKIAQSNPNGNVHLRDSGYDGIGAESTATSKIFKGGK